MREWGATTDGVDLPLGFGMHLAENPRVMEAFAGLPVARKAELIGEIQDGDTGEEAFDRIIRVIERLSEM